MKPGCDYQEIARMKANRAIEHGDRLVFTKKDGDGNVLDERVYLRPRHGSTQWEKLFGTPERAARTVLSLDYCCENCDECPAFEICGLHSKFGRTIYEMTEWLESEVRDD